MLSTMGDALLIIDTCESEALAVAAVMLCDLIEFGGESGGNGDDDNAYTNGELNDNDGVAIEKSLVLIVDGTGMVECCVVVIVDAIRCVADMLSVRCAIIFE